MSLHRLKNRTGLTLLELVVVLAVLAVLAAMMIPKIADITERSRSATQAFTTADVARMLEVYHGLNRKYPDGWDSLTDTSSAIFSKLAPEIETPNTFFTTATLSEDQITSLNTAGISHMFLHDSTSQVSASGTDRRHFGTGTGHDGTANVNTVVVIDESTGSDGLELLVNGFGLNPNRSASDTTYPRLAANTYVVFGLGPKCTLVQTQVHEAPLLEHSTSTTNYSRALVVFEVPNTGTAKAELVGVFGPDGRSKNSSISDFNNINGVPAH